MNAAVRAEARSLSAYAAVLSENLARLVDKLCLVLLVALILDVWLGMLARTSFFPFPLTFTEELARYLMIWLALLAVSSAVSRRQHIGMLFVFELLPSQLHKPLLLGLDLLALAFFGFLFYYGLSFAGDGANRVTMIYGLSKFIPFASVPVATGLACVQILLSAVRDMSNEHAEPGSADVQGEE
ncbi:MAG: TRAP transporter small permease subunit [Oceanospirillales bacterium]|nr:TRAP transporter small permease subunit [Oceanospirillales bacterium]